MLLSGAPSPIQLPFANSGTRNTIPVPSQIPVTAGRASFTDGFPPLTRTPLAAGGVPPFGEDFNGLFYAITTIQQWQTSGGLFPYSAAQATAIGGYPKGALLLKSTGAGFWVNSVDGNATDPDAGGAGWVDLLQNAMFGVDSGSANTYVVALRLGSTSIADGTVVRFKANASNSGACTLNVGSLGVKPLIGAGQEALQGGEIVAGGMCIATWSLGLNSWVLNQCTGGAQPVAPATNWRHAARRDQTIGDGGTALQLVTGSRSIGVSYTNTSARPRIVIIDLNISSGVARAYVGVQEVWFFSGSGGFSTGFLIVPPGATYTVGGVSGSASIEYWLEY